MATNFQRGDEVVILGPTKWRGTFFLTTGDKGVVEGFRYRYGEILVKVRISGIWPAFVCPKDLVHKKEYDFIGALLYED